MSDDTKKCTACLAIFPATTEYFHRSNRDKSGLKPRCKTCTKCDTSLYERTHREQRRLSVKNWRLKNPEKNKEIQRNYYRANVQKLRAKSRDWAKAHPEKVHSLWENWAKTNQHNIKSRKKTYYRNNPEIALSYNRKRRARKKAALINDLTIKQWQDIKAHFGYFGFIYCHSDFFSNNGGYRFGYKHGF